LEKDPKEPVRVTHAGQWLFAFEDGQLLAKGGDLQCKVVAGQKKGPKVSDH
jgi:hypothetical protein